MLTIAIITAVIVQFLHACTLEGMIFQGLRRACEKLPWYLKKPFYDCPTCMSMWWGPAIIALLIVICEVHIQNAAQIFVACMMAGGINAIISTVSSAINKKCDCGRKERIEKFFK